MYKSLLFWVLFTSTNLFVLKAQDTISILFIGNSYTFANLGTNTPELPLRLKEMAEMYGKTVITDYSGSGGLALDKHWKSGKAALKIKSGKFDYVVLQEHSMGTLIHADRFEDYAQKFIELITENNAKPIFYMTWARQNRPEMIDTIAHEYIKVAEQLGAIVAPCGFAWDIAGSQIPGINLYWEDRSHPRPEGVLLNTFVFYNTIFGEIPKSPLYKFAFKNVVISEDTARQLMQAAKQASTEINYQIGDQF